MDSVSLFLTSNHYDASTGDYVLRFNSPTSLLNMEMALVQSNIYKQWENISPTLYDNNNYIKISIPTSITVSNDDAEPPIITYYDASWNIPSGFYRSKDLNKAFQQWCDEDASGNRKTNTQAYPFTLEKGINNMVVMYVNGSNLEVPRNNSMDTFFSIVEFGSSKLANFLGFPYPQSYKYGGGDKNRANAIKTINATYVSQEDPISSIIFTCNCIYNPIVGHPRGIISSCFISDTDFGASASINTTELTWLPIQPATYTEIRISTYSQDGVKLSYYDTNSVFQLALRKKTS
jgi:hypothetical protein